MASASNIEGAEGERRLCALVAVDIAGYSSRTEADEKSAIGVVTQLSRRIAQVARDQGGRVFNTAGDSFMLEFPTASNALEAAEAIIADTPAPVRIGVHVGEVSLTGGGDLLGHGVNVAARLQQLALPGEIVVSDDARRSLRGPQSSRLTPLGRRRLAKMKQVGAVFCLSPDGGARRRLERLGRWVAVAGVLIALGATGLAAWRLAPASTSGNDLTVAVRSFTPGASNPSDAAFGESVADRLTSALAERQVAPVSRDRVKMGNLSGARLVVSGRVEREGDLLRVTVQLDDAHSGLALWSSSYERPAGDTGALRDQAALNVADMIAQLRTGFAPDVKTYSPEALAAALNAIDVGRRQRGNFDEERAAYKRVADLAPNSAVAHASYARVITTTLVYSDASPEIVSGLRAESKAQAQQAVALDPHNPQTYAALIDALPRDAYLEREALLTTGLEANPDAPILVSIRGNLLRSVGRIREGVDASRLRLGLGSGTPSTVTGLIFALAGSGRYDEAERLGQRQARLTPTNNSTRRAILLTHLIYGPLDMAASAIDQYQSGEPRLEPAAETAWRDFVAARQGKLSPAKAAASLSAVPRAEYGIDPSTVMSAYALLGRTDEAFAEIERARSRPKEFYIANLFEGAGTNMRRDPRFMPLAARLGLIAYWTQSGHWPDYCLDQSAPYDCKAAARAAANP